VLGVAASRLDLSPTLILVLWPFSVVGPAKPVGFSDKIWAALEFGSNFVLYGVAGVFIELLFGTGS
jgi:hypothetical protein